MKSFHNILAQNVFLPASDIITGQSISHFLKFLLKSHNWNREHLLEHQLNRLKLLITHSYETVPFYTKKYKALGIVPSDIKSLDDLSILPIITKEELRSNKLDHFSIGTPPKSYYVSFSSGSTGEPFEYRISKPALSFTKAAAIRAWIWNGYNLGDKYIKISMHPRKSIIKRIQDIMNRSLLLASNDLSPDVFRVFLDEIMRFDPIILRGYPVPVLFLANLIKEQQCEFKKGSLLAINTTGSTLFDDTRETIESAFSVNIFDSYSCEAGANFTQCPLCGSYHPGEEYAISEFVADSYTEYDSDRALRHITTDLYNFASPFIRYDTQDYIVPYEDGQVQCSRPFKSIQKIKGRDGDILVTPSKKYFFTETFLAYFHYVKQVNQVQIVQDRADHVSFNLVVNTLYDESVEQQLKEYWQNKFGDDITLSINVVDEIKLTPTGKRRTVIRNPDISI